jgi:hypothetical protein
MKLQEAATAGAEAPAASQDSAAAAVLASSGPPAPGQEEAVAASPAADAGGPQLKEQLQVSLQMCQLEETFAGAIKLKHVDASSSQPLPSMKLSSNAASKAAAAAAAGSAEGRVRSGRPLSEVIAAANAQLAGRYQQQVAAGLKELSERLSKSAAKSSSSTGPTPATPSVTTDAAKPGDSSRWRPQQATTGTTGSGTSDAEQAADDEAHDHETEEEDEEDVYATLSLLRRLLLWPVSANLLRATAAGKRVAALKLHPNPMVSTLAAQLVNHWRTLLIKQRTEGTAVQVAKEPVARNTAAATVGQTSASAPLIDASLRGRVMKQMADALLEHSKAAAVADTADSSRSDTLPAKGAADQQQQLQPREELLQLAKELEGELHAHVTNTSLTVRANPGSSLGASAGQSGQHPALQEYKSRARMLCTGLRHRDGVAAELLSGSRVVKEVKQQRSHMQGDSFCCL